MEAADKPLGDLVRRGRQIRVGDTPAEPAKLVQDSGPAVAEAVVTDSPVGPASGKHRVYDVGGGRRPVWAAESVAGQRHGVGGTPRSVAPADPGGLGLVHRSIAVVAQRDLSGPVPAGSVALTPLQQPLCHGVRRLV